MHRSSLHRAGTVPLLAGLFLAASIGLASASSHVRGQVVAVSGDAVTVETTAGETVHLALKPDFAVAVYHRIALGDLKPDDYLSIPSIKAADGGKQAVAISVFPAALRGVGEGESPWDLGPDSRMTNAAFATLASQGSDHTILVRYKGRQETIEVPAGTPILAFDRAPDRKLAVGDRAVFFATETDGKLATSRAGLMQDGSQPPF